MKKLDLNTTIERYLELQAQISLLEDQKEALALTLKTVMGEQEELRIGTHVVRYKNIVSNRFDTSEFKAKFADLHKQFTKPSTSRRFTIA